MITPFNSYETLYHAGELVGLALVFWRANRALNRVFDILKDFPPHRHINGHILYPQDYAPGQVDQK